MPSFCKLLSLLKPLSMKFISQVIVVLFYGESKNMKLNQNEALSGLDCPFQSILVIFIFKNGQNDLFLQTFIPNIWIVHFNLFWLFIFEKMVETICFSKHSFQIFFYNKMLFSYSKLSFQIFFNLTKILF